MTFGYAFKEARIKRGVTLRTFCLKNGLDAGNMSKYERGLLQPPALKKVAAWLKLLGYKHLDDTWSLVMLSARNDKLDKVWSEFAQACAHEMTKTKGK